MSGEPVSAAGELPGPLLSRLHAPRISTLGWGAAIAAYIVAAAWLAAHPPAIGSDDALFLVRGVTRFSVLDFSPQFPGYPGFVAMARLLLPVTGDPLRALACLAGLVALALPPTAALVAWRTGAGRDAALAAFALTLAGPFMPELSLSLLSDGAGILFLLVFLALLPRAGEQPRIAASFLAGVALGWAAACRPSDAALLAGAALGAFLSAPRLTGAALAGVLAVAAPVASVIWALEGSLYLQEGLRFVSGHALIWGNTVFADTGHRDWLTALAALPGALALAAILLFGVAVAAVGRKDASPARTAAIVAFIAHAGWVAMLQNPDQLRHLAPLSVLGGLVLALLLAGRRRRLATVAVTACLAFELWALVATVDPSPAHPPPLLAAAQFLDAEPTGTAVATNEGVFLLRATLLHTRVYDMHYPADARLGLAMAEGPAFRLTSTPSPAQSAAATFRGRFAGEPALWLYRR